MSTITPNHGEIYPGLQNWPCRWARGSMILSCNDLPGEARDLRQLSRQQFVIHREAGISRFVARTGWWAQTDRAQQIRMSGNAAEPLQLIFVFLNEEPKPNSSRAHLETHPWGPERGVIISKQFRVTSPRGGQMFYLPFYNYLYLWTLCL